MIAFLPYDFVFIKNIFIRLVWCRMTLEKVHKQISGFLITLTFSWRVEYSSSNLNLPYQLLSRFIEQDWYIPKEILMVPI